MQKYGLSKRILSMVAAAVLVIGCVGVPSPTQEADAETTTLPYMDTSLSFEERAADLVSRMTLEEKASQLGNNTAGVARLGVAKYDYWSEGLHGVARSGEATSFPYSIAMAATWDPELIEQITAATADEARGYSNGKGKGLSYWSPTINMARDPRWGRTHETYGEDPYLTTEIGSGFVKGLQGDDEKYLKVIATIKHYAANNSEYNRHTGSSNMDDRTLREYYTRAFKGIVRDANVESVMSSYNRVNGVPAAANTYLLQTLLRETFGFSGYVTSDCGGIQDVYEQHKWQPEGWDHAVDSAEATALCITAGTDIDCGGVYKSNAVAAVKRGLMSEDDIDLALVRMLTARMKTGEFDPAEMVPYRGGEYSFANQVEAEDHKQLAEDSANEAIVLLKNDNNTLPLDINTQKNIVMIGEVANKVELSDYSGTPSEENMSTPIQGMEALGANVTYIQGGATTSTGSYICNLKNVVITRKNGSTTTLLASQATELNGCRYEEGSGNVGYITPGATLKYENVDLTNIASITIQAAGDGSVIPGTITVTMDSTDGMQFASVNTGVTGGWQSYQNLTATVTDAGGATVKDIYLTFDTQKQEVEFTTQEQNQIKNADAVIVCIDGNKSSEGSDRNTIVMPSYQSALANTAAGLNDNTIVYMQTVGVVEVGDFADNVQAILWTSFNGQAQGNAMARVIYGAANPNAKLPMTWYAKNAALPTIDDYNIRGEEDFAGWSYQYYSGPIAYPFGYGLSYSTYEYSNLTIAGGGYQKGDIDNDGTVEAEDALMALQAATQKITLTSAQQQRADVDATTGIQANDALLILQAATQKITLDKVEGNATFTPDDDVTVTVDVTNTSKVDGKETVQLYVAVPENDGVDRPFKQLKSFEKVAIAAGETETVALTLDLEDCYFWDEEQQKNVYDQGEYTLYVGPSSDEETALTTTFTMNGELTPELMVVTATPDRLELNAANTNKVITTDVAAVMNDDTFYDLDKATVTYTSSNPDVVSVDENGIVRAVGGGVATVTASVTVNGKTETDSFPVVVTVELEGIAVNGEMIADFSASTTDYSMPVDGNTLPVVTVPGVPEEYITIQNATSVPGTATVTIELAGVSATYTIRFNKRSSDYVVARFSAIENTYTASKKTLYTDWKRVDGGQTIDFTTHDIDDLHLRFQVTLEQTGNAIVADSLAYKSGQVKLRSKDDPGENNVGWGVGGLNLKTGVNYVDIPLSQAPNSRTGTIDWTQVDRMIFYIDSISGYEGPFVGTISNAMVVDVSVDPEREALWELVDDGVDESLYTPASLVAYREAKAALQALIFQSTPVDADEIVSVKEAYLTAKANLVEDNYLVGTFTKSEGTYTVLNNGTGNIMYDNWQNGDTAPYDLSGDRSNLRLQLKVQFNSKVDTVAAADTWSQLTIKLRSSDRDDSNDPNNREHNYGWNYFPSMFEDTGVLELSIDLSSDKTNSRGSIDWADIGRLIIMADLSNAAKNDAASNDNFSMTISEIRIVDLTNVWAEKEEIQDLLDQTVDTTGASADLVTAYQVAVADAEEVCATEMATSEEVYEAHMALINAMEALRK